MIRIFQNEDLEQVIQIWLRTNIQAHPFIPPDYWQGHYETVKEMLPQSELYVWEESGQIQGFIGLNDDYICGIFVQQDAQSRGIGKKLLDHVKALKSGLTLHVYQKNSAAVRFYEREGFTTESEGTDEDSGEKDYLMVWEHPSKRSML